jgi:hypothetical protein
MAAVGTGCFSLCWIVAGCSLMFQLLLLLLLMMVVVTVVADSLYRE